MGREIFRQYSVTILFCRQVGKDRPLGVYPEFSTCALMSTTVYSRMSIF